MVNILTFTVIYIIIWNLYNSSYIKGSLIYKIIFTYEIYMYIYSNNAFIPIIISIIPAKVSPLFFSIFPKKLPDKIPIMDIKKVVCAINIIAGIIFIFINANEIPIAKASILTLNDKYNIFNSGRE